MYHDLIETITSRDGNIRHRAEADLLSGKTREELLQAAEGLEIFRHVSDNLYHKVRAALFIFSIYRFYLIDRNDVRKLGQIPFEGVKAALERRYDEAIEIFRIAMMVQGLNEALLSALADAYYHLAFKYLADQVKLSISQTRGNHLLFTPQDGIDVPFRVRDEYLQIDEETGLFPLGVDSAPVRADPCHSGWSDIFFLGMDYPSGARVINLSVDLAKHGQGNPEPPIQVFCRFIDTQVIRLVSMDLNCSKDVSDLRELFNFGNDHLGLLKAGVVASGVIPPSMEGRPDPLPRLLKQLLGRPGGFELVTLVKHLPKGSRLAVSTTLLAAIITRLMRFSGQTRNLEGPLTEEERRMVASRAILGEWLGGSGGGWQDSGGIWPGIKIIQGVEAARGDPEFGVSRGRLLPAHYVLAKEQLSEEIEDRLARSIVMVHGGMSQNVGPILEMVTEKYLLRYAAEWQARLEGYEIFDGIVEAVKNGNMKGLGRLTTRDWSTTTKVIIPWATNAFTEDLIAELGERYGSDFWGFLMLGGMAGGGMAFIVNPEIHDVFINEVGALMQARKRFYRDALPFAMDPVVFDFKINYNGIMAQLHTGSKALLPGRYYEEGLQNAAASDNREWIVQHRSELKCVSRRHKSPAADDETERLRLLALDALGEKGAGLEGLDWKKTTWDEQAAERIKQENGFDAAGHEKIKALLKAGKIGVSKNRLPLNTRIEDVDPGLIPCAPGDERAAADLERAGIVALESGKVAVVTYSGGLGSRWTEGAAVVKPINPFIRMAGRHRSFTEIHLAKSRKASAAHGVAIQHAFTTSFLTHEAFQRTLGESDRFGYQGPIHLSRAQAIGHRVYPMERDLRFLWEELPQQILDEQQQKIQDDYREAVIQWTRERGEGEDYCDNLPLLRFNPPGHWHEIPNMFKNGVLARMLKDNPKLETLLVHNTDTLGAWLDPVLLGMHLAGNQVITFEVTPRRFEDKGGGLAQVNGNTQLLEALALPREEDEFKLSYYNTLTNWINISGLLEWFGLTRDDLLGAIDDAALQAKVVDAIQKMEARLPTYVTIKEVKLIWGAGQEDLFPVAQFEKLWGDMSRLDDARVDYIAVDRCRGQQLKDPAQLDRWVRDGSCAFIESLADF